jgi:predicted AlkP superfamily pyrophosphatase or phosphodiesterase
MKTRLLSATYDCLATHEQVFLCKHITMKYICFSLLVVGLVFSGSSYAQEKKEPIVILISLDGFRYDYVERFQPENLTKFIADGVAAESLMPSFPSKTFPNHYTIATGLKPENHGLVDNSFYDSKKNLTYGIDKKEIVQDGTWYGGTPLWVLAEQNSMVSASYFFVGSEADVQGIRPRYYYDYDGGVSNLTRVTQVFKWLDLPEAERPRLITMYFSDMDDVAHTYGPSRDDMLQPKLEKLDQELGALFEGLKSYELNINVIVVSDHGMTDVTVDHLINIDELTADIPARVVNDGALAHVYLTDPIDKDKVINTLEKRGLNVHITDVDDKENYQDLKYKDRIGDILIVSDMDYYMATTSSITRIKNRMDAMGLKSMGEHGYSPAYKAMHGIFYANGPEFKSGLKIETFQNIHIYPMITEILGLPTPKDIDGELDVLAPILKN